MSTEKAKVLFILHIPPPVHGAAMVGQFIRDSQIINTSIEGKYINLSTSSSIEEIGQGGLKKIWMILSLYWTVFFQILKFKPHYCYITLTASGVGFYKDAIIALISKFFGCKNVYHFHNKGVKNCQHKRFDNYLYKKVFSNSKVILLSHLLFEDVKKYVNSDQLIVCPNGIPDMAEQFSKDTNSADSKVKLIFISNLIKSKGILDALEAVSKFKNLNFEFQIVGAEADLSEKDILNKITDLGIEDKVSYLGKKYGEDKFRLLSGADIFVFPTFYHNECFPLSIIEAMSFGLPVVSTNEGAIPDLVLDNENGLIIEKRNIQQLANAIQALILDKDLRIKMGKFSRERFEEKYTLEKFEDSISKIFKNP